MRKSITQESEYGCGIACFAFALDISYGQAEILLGPEQSQSTRFWVKDLVMALSKHDKDYHAKYVKSHLRRRVYGEGTIVLIRRSKHYPVGHYLIRYKGSWMDPWVNLPTDNNLRRAKLALGSDCQAVLCTLFS